MYDAVKHWTTTNLWPCWPRSLWLANASSIWVVETDLAPWSLQHWLKSSCWTLDSLPPVQIGRQLIDWFIMNTKDNLLTIYRLIANNLLVYALVQTLLRNMRSLLSESLWTFGRRMIRRFSAWSCCFLSGTRSTEAKASTHSLVNNGWGSSRRNCLDKAAKSVVLTCNA